MVDIFVYRTLQAYSTDVKKYVNADLDEFEIMMRYLRTERKMIVTILMTRLIIVIIIIRV